MNIILSVGPIILNIAQQKYFSWYSTLLRWTGEIEPFHHSKLTLTNLICYHAIMDYKLLNVDYKHWLCFHKHFFKRLSEWLTRDRKFGENNCFSNSCALSSSSLTIEGVKSLLFPIRVKARICNHLCVVIFRWYYVVIGSCTFSFLRNLYLIMFFCFVSVFFLFFVFLTWAIATV